MNEINKTQRVPSGLRMSVSHWHGWLSLLLSVFALCMAGTAAGQSAPAWGYDVWGASGFDGQCQQTVTYSGATPEAVATASLAHSQSCGNVYTLISCTTPTITAPVQKVDSTCQYGGTYPNHFVVSLVCSPGKSVTPASSGSCVNWTLATIAITAPGSGAALAPGAMVIEVATTNVDGTVAAVNIWSNGTNAAAASYNATTGKWSASFTNIAAGTYVFTALASDSNGNTVTSAPITQIFSPKAAAAQPAWGYDAWGITGFDGQCQQTVTYSGATPEAVATASLAHSQSCGNVYTLISCTAPAIATPVRKVDSTCKYGGSYPNQFVVSLVCSPGKSLTPASPNTCVNWPFATLAISAPLSGAGYKTPATITVEAQATNQNGTVTWVDVAANGGTPVAATYNATSGKWQATFTGLGIGSYTFSAIAGDTAGHTAVAAATTANVYASAPPTASITAPADQHLYAPGTTIPLRATAADSDGTVTQVEFFANATSIGLGTFVPSAITSGAWVSNAWTNVPAGSYTVTARATDNTGAPGTSAPVTVIVSANAATSVSLAGAPAGTTYTAPANVPLTATATNAAYGIAGVQFFSGATVIGTGYLASGTATSGAWVSNAWTNVAAGTYSVTAVATDEEGGMVTSTPITFTVGAASSGANTALYFIDTDHLGTPRLIENQSQQAVWKWDNAEAFGDSVPNENPSSLGAFVFNQRFPGQYADQETNTAYNNARDYDQSGGRYVQSDPIGLYGGINSYAYVKGNPIALIDPEGLQTVIRSTGGGPVGGGGSSGANGSSGGLRPLPGDPYDGPKLPAPGWTASSIRVPRWLPNWMKSQQQCEDEEEYEKCVRGCSYKAELGAEKCLKDHANDPAGYRQCEAEVLATMEICVINCGVKHGF
jgi:RHS repeat-associated protein